MKIRLLIYMPVLFLLLAFQTTLLEYIKIYSVKPNLILVFVICAALLNGKWEGAIVGLVSGLGLDIASGAMLGFHALLFMYVGLLAGLVHKYVFRENYLIALLMTFFGSIVYGWVFFFLRIYPLAGNKSLLYPFLNIILPESVYNTGVSVLLHLFMIKLNRKLEKLDTA
jgi:rod shape-determining protein MreD